MRAIHEVYDQLTDSDEVPQLIRLPVLLASAILFQGTLYMDKTERVVKLCLTIVFGLVLRRILPFTSHKAIKSFAISHLLNFLFNGHPWVLFRHVESDRINNSYDDFEHWMDRLERVGNTSGSIAAVVVYGSLARDQLTDESDLDVRVIRYPGNLNGITSSLIVSRERAKASLSRFPLDIYLFDDADSLSRLRDDEDPKVLVDKENWINARAGVTNSSEN